MILPRLWQLSILVRFDNKRSHDRRELRRRVLALRRSEVDEGKMPDSEEADSACPDSGPSPTLMRLMRHEGRRVTRLRHHVFAV